MGRRGRGGASAGRRGRGGPRDDAARFPANLGADDSCGPRRRGAGARSLDPRSAGARVGDSGFCLARRYACPRPRRDGDRASAPLSPLGLSRGRGRAGDPARHVDPGADDRPIPAGPAYRRRAGPDPAAVRARHPDPAHRRHPWRRGAPAGARHGRCRGDARPHPRQDPRGLGLSDAPDPIPRRLHPATLVARWLKSAPQMLAGAAGLLVAVRDRDLAPLLTFALGFLLLAAVLAALYWWRFRYTIGPGEIVIEKGLLRRQRRIIPFDRVQDIAIERKLLARLFGTAAVRIETGGAAKDEGTLDMIALADAEALRDRVRHGAGPAGAHAEAALPEEPVLFAMDLPRLVLSGLFGFSLVFFAVIAGALQQLDQFGLFNWSDWFTPERADRAAHLITARLAEILPVLAAAGFPEPPPRQALHGVPRRALVRQSAPALAMAALAAAAAFLVEPWLGLAALALLAAALIGILRWRKHGHALGERALFVADGYLKRRMWIVPYEKTQTIRVMRGPVQRALRLSNLLLDTAGSGALVSPEMHDLDAAEAETMADALLARFQAARAGRPPRSSS